MDAKDKAEQLVNEYRILLMNEDTECGNEILCTTIAKQCSLIAVEEIIRIAPWGSDIDGEIEDDSKEYYIKVKEEINKL